MRKSHRLFWLSSAFAFALCSALFTPAPAQQPATNPAASKSGPARGPAVRLRSKVSIYNLKDKSTRVVHTADEIFEAPNWSRDGKYLLSNSGGALWKIPVDGSAVSKLPLGDDLRLNNDHDLSPDGKMLAISASSAAARGSQVYIVNLDGTNRRQMTTIAPSYFHGWSPDGKYIAIVAQRTGGQYDLLRIPAAGGPEEFLTTSPAYDDGPDYTLDGKWIYFNSDRSKHWKIWRMPKDGAGPNDSLAEQVTNDDLEDWFPHPSPDGKWLVWLSFPKGTETHNDRMPGVSLRMMPLPGKKVGKAKVQELVTFYGGQGSINVNSWSPDSKQFGYVSYEVIR